MSKIAFCTDTHLGARGGSQIFRDYFAWYYVEVFFPYLKANDIKEIICLGDFFDNRNHLSLKDIAFVNEIFLPLLDEYDVSFKVIAGNHDLAFKNTNSITSLSVMEHSKRVEIFKDDVVEFDLEGNRFVFVPWINNENYSEFMETLNAIEDKQKVAILGHFEINGFLMYQNSSRCETGLDQSLFKDFKSVWSGHFHHPSKIGNVEYLGALFHFNWQDHGDARGFWVYDTTTDSKEYVENEHCLFSEILYTDDMKLSDQELAEASENQFVKIVINEEYDKVKFMDFYSKVTGSKPIDVQIVNNYAIMHSTGRSTANGVAADTTDTNKSVDEYIESYVTSVVDKDKQNSIMDKFKAVKAQAADEMVKGE